MGGGVWFGFFVCPRTPICESVAGLGFKALLSWCAGIPLPEFTDDRFTLLAGSACVYEC